MSVTINYFLGETMTLELLSFLRDQAKLTRDLCEIVVSDRPLGEGLVAALRQEVQALQSKLDRLHETPDAINAALARQQKDIEELAQMKVADMAKRQMLAI